MKILQKSKLSIPETAGIVAFIYSMIFTLQATVGLISAIITALIFDKIEQWTN